MRMDARGGGATAADLVARAPEAALRAALAAFGEEPRAGAVARALAQARARGAAPRTTRELADLVARALRAAGAPRGDAAPAARTFQALRMAVNGELPSLDGALADVPPRLAPGGAFAVITFHSLEARLVAARFAALAAGGGFAQAPVARPTAEEVAANPRARSAQLRVLVRGPG